MSNFLMGENCNIATTAVIGESCVLGDNVVIHHNVVLYPETKIGNNTEIFDNAVIGRPPKTTGATIHQIEKHFHPVIIGENCVIGACAVIYAECIIGNNCMICDLSSLREGATFADFVLFSRGCTTNHHVSIGNNSKILDMTHLTSRTIVEDDVFVGPNVMTVNDNAMRIRGREVGTSAIIVLKKGSKIGASATILPGLIIGENAIVGANSVVTKNVNDGVCVMGMPAKEK